MHMVSKINRLVVLAVLHAHVHSCVVIELRPRGSRVVSDWIVESKCRASVSLALSDRSLYIFVSSANILKVEEILEDTIIININQKQNWAQDRAL